MTKMKKSNQIKKLDSIDHVAILVDDIPRAIAWYSQSFKCKIVRQSKSWALLKFDNINLALICSPNHPPHIAILDKNLEKDGTNIMQHSDGSVGKDEHDNAGNIIERIRYKK